MSIKCGKCGKVNENIEGKCSECGEFLYQFFVQEQKKIFQKKIYFRGLLVLVGLILIILSFFAISNIGPKDTLTPDLKKYLTQLKNAENYINNSSENKNMLWVVYGLTYDGKFVKNNKSIIDKNKANRYFYTLSYDTYSKITPINQTIYEIHNMLIEEMKLARDAQDNFINGVQLGYITNVKETKDGGAKWSYSRLNAEYSDNYSNFSKKSLELADEFKRKLEQLCESRGLIKLYGEIYPYEANMKSKITDIHK